jgi:two-component system response regulator (stage 0 sporulation protein F)
MSAPRPLPAAIVLVDDEPTVRIILCRLLEVVADGYEIISVGTGAEALATLAERSVPLLITDYNMPGMNGVELSQRVKGTSPTTTTTVVLISAYITAEVEQLSKAAGADYFMSKPFSFEQVEAIVRKALG